MLVSRGRVARAGFIILALFLCDVYAGNAYAVPAYADQTS